MGMEDFITRAAALNTLIGVSPKTFSSMGIAAQSVGARVCKAESAIVTLDKKYEEIDALAAQCRELTVRYEQVSDIISQSAAEKAGEKSGIAHRIEKNRRQCGDIQGEIDRLEKEIDLFEQKNKEYSQNDNRLRDKMHEINERRNSGNNFIPFYGIKYAVDTLNMYDDYKRELSRNDTLGTWLNENYEACKRNQRQKDSLRQQMDKLSSETEALRRKFGDVIEVLQILSCLIAAMGDFAVAAGKAKNALQYSFFEDINEAQTAIDRTLGMIRSYYDVFRRKMEGISGKLEKNTYDRIVMLI